MRRFMGLRIHSKPQHLTLALIQDPIPETSRYRFRRHAWTGFRRESVHRRGGLSFEKRFQVHAFLGLMSTNPLDTLSKCPSHQRID